VTSVPPRAGERGPSEERALGAFRRVPRTGVIYVTGEAARRGFVPGADDGEDGWCNLGQGQPEIGPLPGAPPRCEAVTIAGDDQEFFRAALEEKVIVVPGEFFDVNPGKRRARRASRFKGHVRFSFGPGEDVIERALGRLEKMVLG
jgi:hypothetical protein